jgi:hypothetical protein
MSNFAADRLSAVGHSAGKPRYDNSTRVGRAANRRVELVRTQGSSQAPAPAPVTRVARANQEDDGIAGAVRRHSTSGRAGKEGKTERQQ